MAYLNSEDQVRAAKRHYEANKSEIKARTAVRNKKQRLKNRKYVAFIKELSECVDCGEGNPIVLEFDHVRGKKKMCVSDMRNQSYSIKTIQKEIDKCDIRCANCHRIVTYKRRLEKRDIVKAVEETQEEVSLSQLSICFG
tara:strand:+ start:259 stop:678 length:420 start_codon:yes stop_codon:yes gene_type:complete